MRILGIDTATLTASVALIEDGTIVAEQFSEPRDRLTNAAIVQPRSNHAEVILPLIESLLKEARCKLGDLSGFAISIGPGSFTGLRTGLSTLKGLAYGGAIPVVGVSTLLANAARAISYEGLVCSFLNARKSEVYAALFRKQGDVLDRITEEVAAPASVIIEKVASVDAAAPCLFLGDGVTAYSDLIRTHFESMARLETGEGYPSMASAVAHLSVGRFEALNNMSLGGMVPTYLSAPECEKKVRREAQAVEIPSVAFR